MIKEVVSIVWREGLGWGSGEPLGDMDTDLIFEFDTLSERGWYCPQEVNINDALRYIAQGITSK